VPGVAGTPAPDSRLLEAAHGTGRLAVELVASGRRPRSFLTTASFHNAIVALAAIGGSTNAVVHLLAIAGRLGVDLTLDDFDRIGSRVPVLVDLLPAGRFLMEDFHRAGGLLAVLREVRDLLDPTALTVTGRPLVDHLDDAPIWDTEVIRPRSAPLVAEGGIAVLAATSRRTARCQAGGGLATPAPAPRPGAGVRLDRGLQHPDRRPGPRTSTPTRCWCCAAAGRRDIPACRRCRTCRCRPSCSRRACGTWCGSATGG
jgi:dihydroxy-acid dehydratase